jgi:MFS family permease
VRAYRDLFDHRAARWPLLTSTVSRVTPGMIVLAIIYLLRQGGYGYDAAGLVTAAHQIGVGLASPTQGRLADRFGQTRVLVPDAVVYLAGTIVLTLLVARGASVGLLVLAAGVAGVFYPPVTACSRVVMSRLFPTGRLRETAFALSSIAVELGFIVGPLAAAELSVRVSGQAAVVTAGAIAFVGALGYATTAAARDVPPRDLTVARQGALRSPGVRVMVVALAATAIVFGVIDLVVPAVAEFAGDPQAAGRLIACIAGGSLLGALVYGGRGWPGTVASRLRVLIVVMAVGLTVVPLTLGSLPLFAVGLFIGGLFLGPTTICAFQLIDDLALPGTQTEAQSWTQSAVVAGVAFGTATSGRIVEPGGLTIVGDLVIQGPEVALLVGAVGVGLGALLVNLRFARLVPVLRPGEASG